MPTASLNDIEDQIGQLQGAERDLPGDQVTPEVLDLRYKAQQLLDEQNRARSMNELPQGFVQSQIDQVPQRALMAGDTTEAAIQYAEPHGSASLDDITEKVSGRASFSDVVEKVQTPPSDIPKTEAALNQSREAMRPKVGEGRAKAFVQGLGIPTSLDQVKEFVTRSPIQDVKDIASGLAEIPGKIANIGQTLSTSPAATVARAPLSPEAFGVYGTAAGMLAPGALEYAKAIPGKFVRIRPEDTIPGQIKGAEPPPTVSRGPGITAGDVSAAMQEQTVPEANQQLATDQGPPVPSMAEATQPAPPVREPLSLDELRLMREKNDLLLQNDISQRVTGATHPAVDERLNQIDDELTNIANKELAPQGEQPDASQITSTEGIPSGEVRAGVDEGTPLRQQGETPVQTSQGEQPVATGETVAPATPEEPNAQNVTGGYGASASKSILSTQEAVRQAIDIVGKDEFSRMSDERLRAFGTEKGSPQEATHIENLARKIVSDNLESTQFTPEFGQQAYHGNTEYRIHRMGPRNVNVDGIWANTPGGGIKFLRDLTKWADQSGVTLAGDARRMNPKEGTRALSQDQLKRLYRQFGFKEYGTDRMLRVPKEPNAPQSITAELPVTDSEPHVSAIANRFTQERAARGQIGEVAPGQGLSTADLVQRGLKMSPERVNSAVSRMMQGGDVAVDDAAAIRGEEARLSQRSQQASKAADANPADLEAKIAADNAFKDLTDFHNGPVAQLKNNWANQGRSMQGEIPVDLSTTNGLREKWLKDTGETPPPSMDKTFQKTADSVAKAKAEENGAMQKLGQEIEKSTKGRKLPSADDVRNNIRERMGLEPCKV